MIIIYLLQSKKGEDIKAVEQARWDNGLMKGKINIDNISREDVINKYNNGYYITTEI